jgi:hypothetical protein
MRARTDPATRERNPQPDRRPTDSPRPSARRTRDARTTHSASAPCRPFTRSSFPPTTPSAAIHPSATHTTDRNATSRHNAGRANAPSDDEVGRPGNAGRPENSGRGGNASRPDNAGRGGNAGRPDNAGRGGNAGRDEPDRGDESPGGADHAGESRTSMRPDGVGRDNVGRDAIGNRGELVGCGGVGFGEWDGSMLEPHSRRFGAAGALLLLAPGFLARLEGGFGAPV